MVYEREKSAGKMVYPGRGGRHPDFDRNSGGLGGVPAPGDGAVRAGGIPGGTGVQPFDRGLRNRLCYWRISSGPERPPCRGAVGNRPFIRRIFCRRLSGREGARTVLPGVQHSRRVGVCFPLPGGHELRPEMVSQPEGPCHWNHRRGGGIQRGFSHPLSPSLSGG